MSLWPEISWGKLLSSSAAAVGWKKWQQVSRLFFFVVTELLVIGTTSSVMTMAADGRSSLAFCCHHTCNFQIKNSLQAILFPLPNWLLRGSIGFLGRSPKRCAALARALRLWLLASFSQNSGKIISVSVFFMLVDCLLYIAWCMCLIFVVILFCRHWVATWLICLSWRMRSS